MSEYPSTSPWGPHGPQVGAHTVKPNTTDEEANGWTSSFEHNYNPGAPVTGMPLYVPPKPKSMILAILLPLIFGPLGLLYTTVSGNFQKLAFVVLCALYAYVALGMDGPHRLYIGLINLASIVLSVLATVRYNRNF